MQVLAPDTAMLYQRNWIKKMTHGAAICALLAICASILTLAMTSENAANRDFVSYWAAGQRLVHRSNPYDAAAILTLEKSTGWFPSRPLLMRNPPFALWLTIPLGLVSERAGAVLWSMLILVCLMVSIRLLRRVYGNQDNRLHLLGYLFAPSLACLLAGQTSALAVLGLTLFLSCYRKMPLLAGASLLLCAIKPHLFLPFGTVLLVWAISRRAYRLLSGAALALGISCAVPLLFDPSIYLHYAIAARTGGIEAEFVPSLSELLRIAISPRSAWLQFLPALIGSAWAFWYYRRHQEEWDWHTHGSLLLLVSLLVAPYYWLTDEVILLPAMLQAIYVAAGNPQDRSLYWFAAIDGAVLVEVLSGVQLDSALYVWPTAAWLAWYLWTVRPKSAKPIVALECLQ